MPAGSVSPLPATLISSTGPQDMGRTDAIKHHIDTQGARLIWQTPRQLPMAKREEGQKAVADMYEPMWDD